MYVRERQLQVEEDLSDDLFDCLVWSIAMRKK